jgi:hypothetical protein
MLSVTGSSLGLNGVLGRRELLRVGGLGLFGLSLPDLIRGRAAGQDRATSFGRARSCVVLWVKGGPSHLDTFDMKPGAPEQVRGEFRPVATTVPGLTLCEHLPRTALQAHRLTVLRSLSHDDTNHASAAYRMTTGYPYPRALNLANEGTREDHPQLGSSLAAVEAARVGRGAGAAVPPFVMLPHDLTVNGEHRSGQHAGVLGARFDPLLGGGDPNSPGYRPVELGLEPPVGRGRFRNRFGLRDALQAHADAGVRVDSARGFDDNYRAAFALLDAGATRRAFDIHEEHDAVRERYGRTLWGQSVLLARRLVEAGVRLVHVNWVAVNPDLGWDTHAKNFEQLREVLLPKLDRSLAALLDDLAARGLLEETLVVLAGEFGRTPKVNAQAGRDHWSAAFAAVLAGAGLPGGQTFGATDRQGASVADGRVSPADLAATVFHALGVDPATEISTPLNRPWRVCDGRPVLGLWSRGETARH